MQLVERMNKHLFTLKEDAQGKLEIVIRQLLSEEQEATSHYLKIANKLEGKLEDHPEDAKILTLAIKTFKEIAKEEKAHIGELQALLDKLGISNKEELEGQKEVGEKE